MRKQYGFTAVELAIAMIIIGVLLTMGVVSFRSMQSTSRDKDREVDVQTIATHIEGLYGQDIYSGSTLIKGAGSYPSREVIRQTAYYNIVFDRLPQSAVFSPSDSANRAFVVSTQSALTTGINETKVQPAPSVDRYVYSPLLESGGASCDALNQECRAFVIYYKLESGQVKSIESKRK